MSTRILLATTNPHKAEEIRAVLSDAGVELLDLSALQVTLDKPAEDGDTFEQNAAIKARYYGQATGMLCLADDSGLQVDALDGEPGVLSARYSGETGERAAVGRANNRKLLAKLQGVPSERRTARFVCAMVLWPAPHDATRRVLTEPITVRGTVEGRIITPEEAADPAHPERGRGEHGFGYDPLFLVPEHGKTTAELAPEHKNAISHRGAAVRAMRYELRRRGLADQL